VVTIPYIAGKTLAPIAERVTMKDTVQLDKSERLSVRVDADFLEMLDDLRRMEKDLPSRGEYVRRVLLSVGKQKLQTAAA
jgi:monomeric isocitrate dehydrogenase